MLILKETTKETIVILKSSIESEPQNKKAYYELGKINVLKIEKRFPQKVLKSMRAWSPSNLREKKKRRKKIRNEFCL